MCDYSLHAVATRPAKVGDKLKTTTFINTRTQGFCSPGDENTAVCLLPGTEIAISPPVEVHDIKRDVAVFTKINPERTAVHHDALEFPDGAKVLVHGLPLDLQATVLQLPAEPVPEKPEQAAPAREHEHETMFG